MSGSDGRPVPRFLNPRWQQYLSTRLPSGSAMLVLEPETTGINAATLARLDRFPTIARAGEFEVRSGRMATTPSGSAGTAGTPGER
jgi:hypothetical protein